jgi:hypothetical protein
VSPIPRLDGSLGKKHVNPHPSGNTHTTQTNKQQMVTRILRNNKNTKQKQQNKQQTTNSKQQTTNNNNNSNSNSNSNNNNNSNSNSNNNNIDSIVNQKQFPKPKSPKKWTSFSQFAT